MEAHGSMLQAKISRFCIRSDSR